MECYKFLKELYIKRSFPIRIFSDLVTFTKKILNRKLFCAVKSEVLFYNCLLFLNIVHLQLQCDMFHIIQIQVVTNEDNFNWFNSHSIYLMLKINNALHKKWEFSIKDFFSKYDQICSFLRIWLYLLKKSLMENLIFRAVLALLYYC